LVEPTQAPQRLGDEWVAGPQAALANIQELFVFSFGAIGIAQ